MTNFNKNNTNTQKRLYVQTNFFLNNQDQENTISDSFEGLSPIACQNDTFNAIPDSFNDEFVKTNIYDVIQAPKRTVTSIKIISAVSFSINSNTINSLMDLDNEEERSSEDANETFVSTKPAVFTFEDFAVSGYSVEGNTAEDLSILFEAISPVNVEKLDDTLYQNCYSFANDMMQVKNVFFPVQAGHSDNETLDNSSSQISSLVISKLASDCKPDAEEDEFLTDISIEFDAEYYQAEKAKAEKLEGKSMILSEIYRENSSVFCN